MKYSVRTVQTAFQMNPSHLSLGKGFMISQEGLALPMPHDV
jgi:hypothetical protein